MVNQTFGNEAEREHESCDTFKYLEATTWLDWHWMTKIKQKIKRLMVHYYSWEMVSLFYPSSSRVAEVQCWAKTWKKWWQDSKKRVEAKNNGEETVSDKVKQMKRTGYRVEDNISCVRGLWFIVRGIRFTSFMMTSVRSLIHFFIVMCAWDVKLPVTTALSAIKVATCRSLGVRRALTLCFWQNGSEEAAASRYCR